MKKYKHWFYRNCHTLFLNKNYFGPLSNIKKLYINSFIITKETNCKIKYYFILVIVLTVFTTSINLTF